jgi:hypothetical protein
MEAEELEMLNNDPEYQRWLDQVAASEAADYDAVMYAGLYDI